MVCVWEREKKSPGLKQGSPCEGCTVLSHSSASQRGDLERLISLKLSSHPHSQPVCCHQADTGLAKKIHPEYLQRGFPAREAEQPGSGLRTTLMLPEMRADAGGISSVRTAPQVGCSAEPSCISSATLAAVNATCFPVHLSSLFRLTSDVLCPGKALRKSEAKNQRQIVSWR